VSYSIIIPARYDSQRLPGKALLDVVGKPLVQHVYEMAITTQATQVIIATDDKRIESAALKFGADVCVTSNQHRSGTERIAEVIRLRAFDDNSIVVNVQGDEPLLPAALVDQVAADLAQHTDASVSTLCTPIHESEEIFNPNVCKLVKDARGYAMYFSRAPIPWDRQQFSLMENDSLSTVTSGAYFRHIGLYAYRAGFVNDYAQWPASSLETIESLEQLRVLYNGHKIHVSETSQNPGVGVDTMEDLEKVRRLLT
jgi:3-deoxy-manno-octulosonate cytidylyltransferase (CMP-KDO synthetase)